MLELVHSNRKTNGREAFPLPPLILHPFSSADETSLLLESSRASLVLQGLAPKTRTPVAELDRKLLEGRYAELRMLFYIGKDIVRWTEQCAETARASEMFAGRTIRPETFMMYLLQDLPDNVRAKLAGWGVHDYGSLFRRSFGFHSVFADLPAASSLTADFLRRYHRYLDHWYEQRLKDFIFERPEPGEFHFELYASGEYSSILEKSWTEQMTQA